MHPLNRELKVESCEFQIRINLQLAVIISKPWRPAAAPPFDRCRPIFSKTLRQLRTFALQPDETEKAICRAPRRQKGRPLPEPGRSTSRGKISRCIEFPLGLKRVRLPASPEPTPRR